MRPVMLDLNRTVAAVVAALLLPLTPAVAQTAEQAPAIAALERLEALGETLRHRLDALDKAVDDNLWFARLGDVAVVEKVRIYGPPRRVGMLLLERTLRYLRTEFWW